MGTLPPSRAMQIAPIIRINANNSVFVPKRPLLARMFTGVGAICIMRRGGMAASAPACLGFGFTRGAR